MQLSVETSDKIYIKINGINIKIIERHYYDKLVCYFDVIPKEFSSNMKNMDIHLELHNSKKVITNAYYKGELSFISQHANPYDTQNLPKVEFKIDKFIKGFEDKKNTERRKGHNIMIKKIQKIYSKIDYNNLLVLDTSNTKNFNTNTTGLSKKKSDVKTILQITFSDNEILKNIEKRKEYDICYILHNLYFKCILEDVDMEKRMAEFTYEQFIPATKESGIDIKQDLKVFKRKKIIDNIC